MCTSATLNTDSDIYPNISYTRLLWIMQVMGPSVEDPIYRLNVLHCQKCVWLFVLCESLKHLTLMWKSTCHTQTYPQRQPSVQRSFPPSWPHLFLHRRPALTRWYQSYLQRNNRWYREKHSIITGSNVSWWSWNIEMVELTAYLTGQQTLVPCIRVHVHCNWHLLHAVATICTCLFFLCKQRA